MNWIILADSKFGIITPDPGLAIWTAIIFVILWIILGKFAFGPIRKALKDREESIDTALKSAEKARQEMAMLTAQNEAILQEAREEKNKILGEAKTTASKIVEESHNKAKVEYEKILADAKRDIESSKKAAIVELKSKVGELAVDIAENLLKDELKSKADQQAFIAKTVENSNLN